VEIDVPSGELVFTDTIPGGPDIPWNYNFPAGVIRHTEDLAAVSIGYAFTPFGADVVVPRPGEVGDRFDLRAMDDDEADDYVKPEVSVDGPVWCAQFVDTSLLPDGEWDEYKTRETLHVRPGRYRVTAYSAEPRFFTSRRLRGACVAEVVRINE